MGKTIDALVRRVMSVTPFELRRRRLLLPEIDLSPLDMILEIYRARGEIVNFIQVGACDGVQNDPIHPFICTGLTRSILIEPNPLAFSRLQKNYAGVPGVTFVQAAIGDKDGETFLYRVKRTDKSDNETDPSLQVASFFQQNLYNFKFTAEQIEKITVPCRTLVSIVREYHLDRIDHLQVDAEGYDAKIVEMALKMQVRPRCISFEHVPVSDRKTLYPLLKAENYLVTCDRSNALALQQDVLREWQSSLIKNVPK